MGRTISARLSGVEVEAVDSLAVQKGVSRSELLASIARQAIDGEAKQGVDTQAKWFPEGMDDQTKQLLKNVDIKGFYEDEALHNVSIALPRLFTCPECGGTSDCAKLCPTCGKLELYGCTEECSSSIQGWFLSEMYHPIKVD